MYMTMYKITCYTGQTDATYEVDIGVLGLR